jgi:hypothetical protein
MRILAFSLVLMGATSVSAQVDWVSLPFEPLPKMPAVDADVPASPLEGDHHFSAVYASVSRCHYFNGTPLVNDVVFQYFFRFRGNIDGTFEPLRVLVLETTIVARHKSTRVLTDGAVVDCAEKAAQKTKPGPHRRFTVLVDVDWSTYGTPSRWNSFVHFLNPWEHQHAGFGVERGCASAVLCATCVACPASAPLLCACTGMPSANVCVSCCSTSGPGALDRKPFVLSSEGLIPFVQKPDTNVEEIAGRRRWIRRRDAQSAPAQWVLEHRRGTTPRPEHPPLVTVVKMSISGWPKSIPAFRQEIVESRLLDGLEFWARDALYRKKSALIGDDGVMVASSASATVVVEPHGIVYIVKEAEGSPFLLGVLQRTHLTEKHPPTENAYELDVRVSLEYEAVPAASTYPFDLDWDAARPMKARDESRRSAPSDPSNPSAPSTPSEPLGGEVQF